MGGIEIINVEERWVMMKDGTTVPLYLFDDEGDPVEDRDEAFSFSFGSSEIGWGQMPLSNIIERTLH